MSNKSIINRSHSKAIPHPKSVGKGITSVSRTTKPTTVGKLGGTSKTNYIKGKNYFTKGDKAVKVPKVADTNSVDGGGLRNTSPMTDGRQFTGNAVPNAQNGSNIKSISDVVKTVLWEPGGSKTKLSKKLSNKKGSK